LFVRIYQEFAHWWPLFSPPEHYVEEVDDILPVLIGLPDSPPRTVLELGSGGGSMAYHLKKHFTMTLTDLSDGMLAASRTVNPECEHIRGDMRTIDLQREFDLVFIHDAIAYMADEASLRAAFRTAYRHCRRGGGLAILPDHVTESFTPSTSHGGEDAADGRGMRYLEWTFDPNPNDTVCETNFAFLFRHQDGHVTSESERHLFGLFPRASWMAWLEAEGFANVSSRIDPWNRDVFTAQKLA
jgi:ubiquinone/menaquinone biosynthesis C-methylase UbiE